MNAQKITQSLELFQKMLEKYRRPCMLWSGGKDSMVLLHLVKFKLGLNLPIVCWREPWMPKKQVFTNQVIQDWELEVWDWAPSAIQLCSGKGRIDVMNHYQISSSSAPAAEYLILARGTEPPVEGLPFLCGVETFLSRPLGTFNFPWDCAFHGHKSSDEDPCSGKIALKVDVMQNPLSAAAIFPLREWSDEDIFDYTLENGLPYDKNRYDLENGKVLLDKVSNPDYYHTCFNCCDKNGPAFVHCPKHDIDMNNIHHLVPWTEPKLEYCSLRDAK